MEQILRNQFLQDHSDPKNSLDAFTQFGANSVMGCINSLTPNIVYIIKAEAMENGLTVQSQAEVGETIDESVSPTRPLGEVGETIGYTLCCDLVTFCY